MTGTVTLAGKPVPGAKVIFVPAGGAGEEARGTSDAAGVYTLATGPRPGCAAGSYRVAVFSFQDRTPEMKPPIWLVPLKYTDVKTSGLTVDVAPDRPPGAYALALKP